MSTLDSPGDALPPVSAVGDTGGPGPVLVPPVGPAVGPRVGRIWLFALVGSLLAGLGSWGLGEAIHPLLAYRSVASQGTGTPTAEGVAAAAYNRVAYARNSAFYYGEVGACLALGLGLAGGLAARCSVPRAATAGGVSLAMGGLVGALTTWGVVAYRVRYPVLDPSDLVNGSMDLCGIWGPIGLVSGWALGLGLGRRDRVVGASVSGLVGGILATGFYPVLVSAVTIIAPSYDVVGGSAKARLIGALVLSLCVGIAASRGATTGPSARTKVRSVPPVVA